MRLIAAHTLGEALHLRLTLLLGILGAGLIVGARWLRDFNFGAAELKFIGDFGLGAVGLFGMLLAALVPAQLFFGELQSRVAYCILTRPVRRWEYVAGKLVGIAGLLALFVSTLGALLGGLMAWRAAELGVEHFGLRVFLAACALQWLKLTLVAAITLVVCSYASSALFASCLGLLVSAVGHLRGFANDHAAWWLRVWPNLALFDAEGVWAAGAWPTTGWLTALGIYWAAYVMLCGGIAAWVFSRREL